MNPSQPIPVTLHWTARALRSPYVLGLQALVVLAMALHLVPAAIGLGLTFAGGLFQWLDYFRGAREHTVAGRITIEAAAIGVHAGARQWRIDARKVTGATTARGAEGWDLTLQQRGALPLVLEGLDEGATQAICQALGIGWKGVGTLAFRDARPAAVPLLFAFASVYVLPVAAAFGAMAPAALAAVMLAWTLVFAAISHFRKAPVFTMAEDGMTFAVSSSRYGIDWRELSHVERTECELLLWTRRHPFPQRFAIRERPGRGVLSRYEADLVVQHVTAAMDRARGLARPRRIDVTGELLHQGALPTAEWHAQLDRMAAELSGRGGGYRSSQLSLEQLHDVLANPDADPLARIGAARIVARVEGEGGRPRIEMVRNSLRAEEHEAALDEALALQAEALPARRA